MALTIVFQAALWIWLLGCVTTYRIGGRLLVEGEGVKSAEFVMLCLYSLGLAAFYCIKPAGRWMLFGVLAFWFAVQFRFHWYYTIFGAGEDKLKGYNECFSGTLRVFPASEKRLIPDLYHIVLHALILINALLCALVRY